MLGAYVHEKFRGVFHGKAINLSRKLCEEYDKALESYDVLVLPTIVKSLPKTEANLILVSPVGKAILNHWC